MNYFTYIYKTLKKLFFDNKKKINIDEFLYNKYDKIFDDPDVIKHFLIKSPKQSNFEKLTEKNYSND